MDTYTVLMNCYQQKEIPREPVYPWLSIEEELILENIIFRQNDVLQEVDALFIFGSKSHKKEQTDFIQKFVNGWRTKNIIISWGSPDAYWNTLSSEAWALEKTLQWMLSKQMNYSIEEKSTNSFENVLFTNRLWCFDWYKKIGFLCAEHASRRDFWYMKWLLKNIDILQFAIPYIYHWSPINKSNWKNNASSKSRIWWEFLRVYKYSLEYWNFDVSDIYDQIKKLERYI